MTVQPSSFLAVLSAAALLLVSGNPTSAHSHKQNGTPIVAGSTHNDPRYPPIVAGSTHHDPVLGHRKPLPCGSPLSKPGDCNPPKPPCRIGPHGECIPNY